MKKIFITTTILSSSLLLLSACGGGSSSTSYSTPSIPTPPPSNQTMPTTGTAFYVDSAVEGVEVICGNTVSTTDVRGAFTYEDGKDCQFKIGNVVIHQETALYDGKVIIEDDLKTAQFLQSMDYDGDANNGIKIHNQTGEVLAQHNIHSVPTDDDTLANAVVGMQNSHTGYHGDFVHQNEAQEHLNNTHQEHNMQQENTQEHNQNDTYYNQDSTQQHNTNDTYNNDTQQHNSNDRYDDNDKNHR